MTVLDGASGQTRVRVDYDLTALGARGARHLETFAEGFAGLIAGWEAAIAAALRDDPRGIAVA